MHGTDSFAGVIAAAHSGSWDLVVTVDIEASTDPIVQAPASLEKYSARSGQEVERETIEIGRIDAERPSSTGVRTPKTPGGRSDRPHGASLLLTGRSEHRPICTASRSGPPTYKTR